MCRSWCEAIIAIVVIVFALWDTWAGAKWVLLIAGIVLLIHSFTCKKCFTHKSMMMPAKKSR